MYNVGPGVLSGMVWPSTELISGDSKRVVWIWKEASFMLG